MRRDTLNLPEELIDHLKQEASELGIGYQTLIRVRLMECYRQKAPIKWGKGKPQGSKIKLKGKGKSISEMVLEDR